MMAQTHPMRQESPHARKCPSTWQPSAVLPAPCREAATVHLLTPSAASKLAFPRLPVLASSDFHKVP